jgi:probable F420-dependent oxidoreductase
MKLGITMSPTEYSIRPDELARACEERGFESIWFPEHSHIPVSRRSPVPTGAEEMPKEYAYTYDLFAALTAAAGATKTIKLGSGICLAAQRDPITMAKQVASLDQLSNGRVLFGIGGGWNAEEMENHGAPFARRWKILREKIEAMKAIWTQKDAEYHGEFVNFDPIWSYPKPVQQPHPPVLLGTLFSGGLHRVINYCDGWLPVGATVQDLPVAIHELRTQAEQAGRKANEVPVSIFMAPDDEAVLRQYQDMGAHRAIFFVPPESAASALPLLDTYARFVPQFQ